MLNLWRNSSPSYSPPPPELENHPLLLLFVLRALYNSFPWGQLEPEVLVSSDGLGGGGEWEWGGMKGGVYRVGRREPTPIPLKPILCSLGSPWCYLLLLLYFTLRWGGRAGEGDCIWVPGSPWPRDSSCAWVGRPVQLALSLFLAREQRGPGRGARRNHRASTSCWGGLWAAGECFLWARQLRSPVFFPGPLQTCFSPIWTTDWGE